ncbi:hypothetical protein [Arthrobacter castelli]|uniref:hypothetical protein n=1 Tax=Arthrobacter castelli TaxID=271431 RepID=UPI0012DEF057|nr:hypothetical protein [Arthrobacter castelli]
MIRPETAGDRPGILALTGAAFAVADRPGEVPVEVGLYEQLFDCDEYIPELSLAAVKRGERAIMLLGSTEYYPRFGFVPASELDIEPPEAAWGDHFQALLLPVLRTGVGIRDAGADHSRGLPPAAGPPEPPVSGTFRYAAPFNDL